MACQRSGEQFVRIVVYMRWLTALAFLVACNSSSKSTSAPPSKTAGPAGTSAVASPDETGRTTTCTKDAECYCRVFDGAGFKPGREPFKCCTDAAGCTDAVGQAVPAGHCMTCVYD